MNAPIALFAYNRATHLANTIAALQACSEWAESPVIVYCDGPRSDADARMVEETRQVVRGIEHANIRVVAAESNQGLANSIIKGVTDICARFGRVIVVEDDLIVSPLFLGYMNRALDCYSNRRDVLQVSGHMYQVPEFLNRNRVLLLPLTTTWGWGTWKRAWDLFQPEDKSWERLRVDDQARRSFDLDNTYGFLSMLEAQANGKCDSWGIRWYWSVFAANGLVCHPPVSLVANAGMDGSGTHGRGRLRKFSSARLVHASQVPEMCGDESRCSDVEFSAVKRAIWRQNGRYLGQLVDWLKSRFN